MLCIEECKKSNTCTIFVRGGNKMVNSFGGFIFLRNENLDCRRSKTCFT
jgi:hypothetical protein